MTRDRRQKPRLDKEIEALVKDNMRLAHMVAWRWAKRTGVDVDDLEQCSMIGLLKAAKAFKAERGNRFSTLAVPYCQGEILHYLRDRCTGNGLIRLPYRWREAYPKGRRMMDAGLTDDQIAARLDMSVEEWIECRAASTAHNEELMESHGSVESTDDVQEEPIAQSYLLWTDKAYNLLSTRQRRLISKWTGSTKASIPEEVLNWLWDEFKRVRKGDKPQRQLFLFDSARYQEESTASRTPSTRRRREKAPQPTLFSLGMEPEANSNDMTDDDVFRELVARRRRRHRANEKSYTKAKHREIISQELDRL